MIGVLLLALLAPTQLADRAAGCEPGASYCLELQATSLGAGASGFLRLLRPSASPFTVDVDRDGRHRYETEFVLSGLPEPSDLGPFAVLVAWVVSPSLDDVQRLGVVTDGTTRVGALARNKYMIWISAEADPDANERMGPLVLRGLSASTRMEPHAMMGLSAFADAAGAADPHGGPMPPMPAGVLMVPGMSSARPSTTPYLPELDNEAPLASPRRLRRVASGDTLRLEAGVVRRSIGGRIVTGYGFNGQIPGPLIQVDQASEIFVVVQNNLPEPTAVHWHGLRLENAFDGVPGLTQEPVEPGAAFTYRLRFPDGGLYWYHPHHREDIQQDLGLYGNIRVVDDDLVPADQTEYLMLDDLLIAEEGLIPYGEEAPNFALMGRFGNRILTNGEPRVDLSARLGERLRLMMTNVSNTRTFNWSVDGQALQVLATDVGRYPEAIWVESVVMAPAERYIVDVLPTRPGRFAITNRVQSIDHGRGRFFSTVDTLGYLTVTPGDSVIHLPTPPRPDSSVVNTLDHLQRPVDLALDLTLRTDGLPAITRQMMLIDRAYFNPVEWTGTMPHMNWSSTGNEVAWILRDVTDGSENMDVDWRFRVGDVVKVRLRNDPAAVHAMQHPIHIHGQRFLVTRVNGEPTEHMAWKDTVLIPVGAEVELLLELSNPGKWMIHCHIAEHLAAGMRMVFEVDP